jgi:hypothetical protein
MECLADETAGECFQDESSVPSADLGLERRNGTLTANIRKWFGNAMENMIRHTPNVPQAI